MIIFRGFRHIPQGGFEPPQAEPESAVLPLHNRGKLTEKIIAYIAIPCQENILAQNYRNDRSKKPGAKALQKKIHPCTLLSYIVFMLRYVTPSDKKRAI